MFGGVQSKSNKIQIIPYSDEKFETQVKDLGVYTALLNPSSYTESFATTYTLDETTGTSGETPKYNGSETSDMNFEFLFDQTGAIRKSDEKLKGLDNFKKIELTDNSAGITKEISEFKKVIYSFNGEIHKPNYLKICWGDLLFHCVLKDLTIEYKLFNREGKPLRAIAKAKFISLIENTKRLAKDKLSSPDLTHYRKVKDGENLQLMTYRIYGDPKYYLEVAKVNKLRQFRKLKPGTELFFPPLTKLA